MMRTGEEQYLHGLIESYVAPLRKEVKELREKLNADKVNENDLSHVVNVSCCPNCGCGKPKKTYDGYWCKMCKTEF